VGGRVLWGGACCGARACLARQGQQLAGTAGAAGGVLEHAHTVDTQNTLKNRGPAGDCRRPTC